jgi:LPS-assembly lipoprotein
VQKVFMHDGNNLVGSDQEANDARREMRRDLVQRMMLRLQQLTPGQLAIAAAGRRPARAEADALKAAQAEAETRVSRRSNCRSSKTYGALRRPVRLL